MLPAGLVSCAFQGSNVLDCNFNCPEPSITLTLLIIALNEAVRHTETNRASGVDEFIRECCLGRLCNRN